MKDLDNKSSDTRDALIEERKQGIIHQRMKDEHVVLSAIESIMDDNVRTGIIDSSLCEFFVSCCRVGLHLSPWTFLSPENQAMIMDKAATFFYGLYDRIYYDVLEDDALGQATLEVDAVINKSQDLID